MKRLILLLLLVSAFVPAQAQAVTFNNLFTRCNFDITRMIVQVDPIAQWGVNPSAHKHYFYGMIRPTEFSVANSTLPVPDKKDPGYWVDGKLPSSTCRIYGNWPSYWSPAAVFQGQQTPKVADPNSRNVASSFLLNTYRARTGQKVLPGPYGMAVVVGNSHATSEAQMSPRVGFTCGGIDDVLSRKPKNCTNLGVVTAVAVFPDCWNGQHGWGNAASRSTGTVYGGDDLLGWDTRLSGQVSFDIKAGISGANFAYGTDTACPANFPHRIAQLVTRQHFTDPRTGGPLVNPYVNGVLQLSFSSGPYYTYHVDYWNRWGKQPYNQRIAKCLNQEVFPFSDRIDCNEGLIP